MSDLQIIESWHDCLVPWQAALLLAVRIQHLTRTACNLCTSGTLLVQAHP